MRDANHNFDRPRVQMFTSSSFSYEYKTEGSEISYTIRDRGHSFGSVIQDVAMMRRDELGILTAGYYQWHPLDTKIFFRVTFPSTPAPRQADETMSRLKLACVEEIERMTVAASKTDDTGDTTSGA